MTRLTALVTTLAMLVAPLPLRADEPEVPVANPSAKVEQIRGQCERRYTGQSLGALSPSTYCKVYAWSELGKSYPALLDVARELQREYNQRTGELNEVRKHLRRERQQSDRLSARLGKVQSQADRMEGRSPTWLTWTLVGVAAVGGGAAGYGIGQALP